MSKFLSSWVFETEFDDDKLRIKLKPLSREDALRFAAFDKSAPEFVHNVLGFYGELVPRYVEDINGLADANGEAVTVQTVIAHSYFNKLVAQIGLELIGKGAPQKSSQPVSQPISASTG